MIFDPTSRYYRTKTAVYRSPDGHEIVYKRRRILPSGSTLPLLGHTAAREDDRLDLIAARTLGNPELFWRICDANDVLNPLDFLDRRNRVLRIPRPTV